MDNIDIDVAGMDILNKNYSILIVHNNNTKIGYRFKKDMIDHITKMYKKFNGNKISRANLKGRLYSSIVILLIKELIKRKGPLKEPRLLICPDLDGHQEQIKSMLFDNLKRDVPQLDKEDMIFARHPRKSVIQQYVTNLYHGELDSITLYNFDKKLVWGMISK